MWALLSLAIGSFGIGMTEFVVMGLLPEHRARTCCPTMWATSQEDAIAQTGLAHHALRARRRRRRADDRRVGREVPAPPRHGRPRPRAHRLQRADLPAPDVRAGRGVALPRGAAARRVLRHRRARRRRRARARASARRASRSCSPASPSRTSSASRSARTSASRSGWRAAFMVVDRDLRRSRPSASPSSCRSTPGDPGRTLRAELKVFRIGQVWLALGVGAIGFGGFFAVYSYVAPMVTEVAGSPEWVGADHPRPDGPRHDGRQPRRRPPRRPRPQAHARSADSSRLAVVLALLALTAQWIFALGVLRLRDRLRRRRR